MRDYSLLIVTLGVILVSVCSCKAQNFGRSSEDETLRMASDSLVVKSYREEEDTGPAEEPDYRSYQGVMGRPGVDFPVLRNIPATDFNCRDVKRPGYYADLATDCQVFHICDGGRKISFLCPNGTIFRQSHLICDWWFRVDCGKSVELYEESAEQLAADQKIYQERSIERERRRKFGKTTRTESDEESSGGEVYTSDDSFNGRFRSRERNSKKVVDSKSAEKFPNYYTPEKVDNTKATDDKIKFNRGNDGKFFSNQGFQQQFRTNYRTSTTPATVNDNNGFKNQGFQKQSSVNYRASTSAPIVNHNRGINNFGFQQQSDFNFRTQTPTPTTYTTSNYNSLGFFENYRNGENIQGAESGSLVGNLRNSVRHDNSFHFDAKLPEYKLRVPTSTERQFYNFRTTTETRRQEFTRPTTVQSGTSRRDFGSSANTFARESHFLRGQTTPKYIATDKPSITQQVKLFSTTPSTPTYVSLSAATTASPNIFKSTELHEEESISTEKVPVETFYVGTYGPENGGEVTTASPVDISLSQLNINKPTPKSFEEHKNYEDEIREGLEIPPSSGPNALRSFALYFAGDGGDSLKKGKETDIEPKDLFYIPTVTENEQKLNTFEEKKKDVVERVDTIIKDNITPTGDGSAADALPSSLTQQTRDSYSALFDKNRTQAEGFDYSVTEPDFGTTSFEGFTEETEKINRELKKNDLDSSQSRGLVEPDSKNNDLNDEFSKVSPDLRELAQVFTKALSAYLDDPQAFRKVLSEIRPTEPSVTEASTNPIDYPSVTQEDDEVLDFSDVTKSSYRRKSTTPAYKETTTEYFAEAPTTNVDTENLVEFKLNQSSVKVPDVELRAPLLESLDESQSSYYTPSPSIVGTTNAIAEEINSEFAAAERLPDIDSNEAVDSYLPIQGSVADKSRPRYGGFQNNSNYSPIIEESSTKPYSPYGAELTSTTATVKDNENELATTFNPRNITSSILFRKKPELVIGKALHESTLAKQLNNLAVTDNEKETDSSLSEFESIKLGNGETIERIRTRSTTARPVTSTNAEVYEPKELSIELSPPFNTDPSDGYYEFDPSLSADTADEYRTTTFPTTIIEHVTETFATSQGLQTSKSDKFVVSTTEEQFTDSTAPTPKSFERIAELQQTLMFNTHNITHQQMEKARITVAQAVDNMTDSTANTLMKMMEMAAKNETYRRLVLLLVNDKSGKNKTVEETRLALLRALLMPVISSSRTRRLDSDLTTTTLPPTTTNPPSATTIKETKRRGGHFRRSKSISNGETRNVVRITTTESPKERTKNGRKTKSRVISRVVKTTDTYATTVSPVRLTNLELINRTIDNSRSKDIKTNSLEDAILDSDSRAVELLRSLYSLAARWG